MIIRRCDWCGGDYDNADDCEMRIKYEGYTLRVEVNVKKVLPIGFDEYIDLCTACKVHLFRAGTVE